MLIATAVADAMASRGIPFREAHENVGQQLASIDSLAKEYNVTLDASPSFDPEGQLLTYAWSVSGGTCNPALGNTATVDCAGLSSGATVTFTLTVTDPGGLSSTTTRSVTLQ